MRRAAVSVPSNIAEGKGRHSHKELVQFLFRARGSLLELETQLSIARELDYIDSPGFMHLNGTVEEVGRLLNGLIIKSTSDERLFNRACAIDLRSNAGDADAGGRAGSVVIVTETDGDADYRKARCRLRHLQI